MNDHDVDQMVRAADPYPDHGTDDMSAAREELADEIVRTPRTGWSAHPVVRPVQIAALAVAAVAALVMALAPGMVGDADPQPPRAAPATSVVVDGGRDRIVFAAAAVDVAEKNPRLLIDEPGWQAVSVGGFAGDSGSITFAKGERRVEMDWYPAGLYKTYYDDRSDVGGHVPATIDGTAASMVRYSASDVAVMLEPEGSTFVEIRTARGFDGADDVSRLLGAIRHVDVDTWLRALPRQVVRFGATEQAVDRVLADIPTPPGFDVTQLDRLGVNDRYQFGAEAVNLVVCGWLDEWQRADRAGDETAAASARKALGGIRGWKVLTDMAREGDYSDDMWAFSDKVNAGESLEHLVAFRSCSADD
ncbi:MAG: hypothetical protein ABWY58_03290 [Aeromicrobium sp.]